jgi:hypothetical protein
MEKKTEKRRYKRQAIELELSCRKIGSTDENHYAGCTVNVSPGGLYFETASEVFNPGNLLKVDLSIPPAAGQLEFGGRFSGFARVLRTDQNGPGLSCPRFGVALEFCQSPKLCT